MANENQTPSDPHSSRATKHADASNEESADVVMSVDVSHVCNALLAYVYKCMKNCPFDIVKKTVVKFYTPDEVKEAKKVLWATYATQLEYKPRKGSAQKSKSEFEVEDIMNAMEVLSDDEVKMNFHVSADDLDRIPKCQPGELVDFAVMNKVARLEEKLLSLGEDMTTRIEKLERLERHPDPSYARIANNRQFGGPAELGNRLNRRESTSTTQTALKVPAVNTSQTDQKSQQTPVLKLHQVPPRPSGQAQASRPINPIDEGTSQDSDDGFQMPKNRRRDRRERRARFRGQQNTDFANPFRGAPPPKRFVFVSRVQKNCGEKDIVDHVEKMNSDLDLKLSFKEFDVKCVSHVDAKFKSFCVTCSIDDYAALMDEKVWPHDVYVSKFYNPRNGFTRKENS